MHIHGITSSPVELCCPLKVTIKSLPIVTLFIGNIIWRIWSCLLNYTVILSDSRKTTDTLGSPCREGDKFVQTVVGIPLHNSALSSDSKNVVDQIVGEVARKTVFDLSWTMCWTHIKILEMLLLRNCSNSSQTVLHSCRAVATVQNKSFVVVLKPLQLGSL